MYMYLDNLLKPTEYQGHRLKVMVTIFLFFFVSTNNNNNNNNTVATRGWYLTLSKAWWSCCGNMWFDLTCHIVSVVWWYTMHAVESWIGQHWRSVSRWQWSWWQWTCSLRQCEVWCWVMIRGTLNIDQYFLPLLRRAAYFAVCRLVHPSIASDQCTTPVSCGVNVWYCYSYSMTNWCALMHVRYSTLVYPVVCCWWHVYIRQCVSVPSSAAGIQYSIESSFHLLSSATEVTWTLTMTTAVLSVCILPTTLSLQFK